MAIPEVYLNNVGSLTKCLSAIQTAGVPDRVTFEFLKTLGFKSSNDRPIISVLKGIGFLDANASPTSTYRAYRNPTHGPKVLAKALRTAYADLFMANTKAHELSIDKLKGIIATKVSKGDAVVKLMAKTFTTLAKAADFSGVLDIEGSEETNEESPVAGVAETEQKDTAPAEKPRVHVHRDAGFHYNIQIHLPTTTDITIYNAIFRSLRENLS